MKRVLLFITMLVLLLVSCTPVNNGGDKQDEAPKILGAVDKTISKGDPFIPLEGITATDKEDGNLTSSVEYSGNVNPNVVGFYKATYIVTDSFGNMTKVTVTITVVNVDEDEPILTGVGDLIIFMGDPDFNPLSGVSANDTVDGDLTSKIVVTGKVDVWSLGEQELTYKVSDESGNEATKIRKVTVSLGEFIFDSENLLDEDVTKWESSGVAPAGDDKLEVSAGSSAEFWGIDGGEINEDIHPFLLIKLTVVASANKDLTVQFSLSDTTTSSKPVVITTEAKEQVIYFRANAPLDNAIFKVDFLSAGIVKIDSVVLAVGSASDDEAPVLTIPNYDLYLPMDGEEALNFLALRGVSSVDNTDGNLSKEVTFDYSEVDFDVVGEYTMTYISVDKSGNEATKERTVYIMNVYDTGFIKDPGFDGSLDPTQWGYNAGNGTVPTFKTEDGMLVHFVDKNAEWGSSASPEIKGLTTNVLHAGNWYMLKFDVKATVARQMVIRSGLSLNGDPWIEDFEPEVKSQYKLTDEWQTIYYIFYVENAKSADGVNTVKVEIQLGTFTWGSEERNNPVYIDNFQYYLLTDINNDPVITPVSGLEKTFVKGSPMPDFKGFVTINDVEDGDILVTEAMIDASDVDMATAGTYEVVYTVTDSGGVKATYVLVIKVIEEEDEEAPVITLNPENVLEFDQFDNVVIDFTTYITAVDNVDGEIIILESMVNKGTFNINKAGTYEIIFTVLDSSLNEATKTINVVVNDKEGPVIHAQDLVITILDEFDPLDVLVVDNVDGPIALVLDNISGLDAFYDDGVITTTGEFEITYEVEDSKGNISEKTITITILEVEFDVEDGLDLLALQQPIEGQDESESAYNEDGSVTVTYKGTKGWYASYSKFKFLEIPLVEGNYYKFVFEAKAETARDMVIYFVDSEGAIKGFDNPTKGNKKLIELEEDFVVFEVVFKAENTGNGTMEIQFGWENYLKNSDAANVITIKQIVLIPSSDFEPEDPYKLDFEHIMLDDFESYLDNDDLAQSYMHLHDGGSWGTNTENYFLVDDGYLGSQALKERIKNNMGFGAVRFNGPITAEGITDDYLYFAFWLKADQFFIDNGIEVRLYHSGGNIPQNIDIKDLPAEGGWVYIKLSSFGIEATKLTQYAIGHNGWKGNYDIFTLTIDNIILIKDPSVLGIEPTTPVDPIEPEEPGDFDFDHIMLDDFEDYEDTADLATVYQFRYNDWGTDTTKYGLVETGYEGSKAIEQTIKTRTGYQAIKYNKTINVEGITDDYLYLAFWLKADQFFIDNGIEVRLYYSGGNNPMNISISDLPLEGGWVWVKLSNYGANYAATKLTQFAIGQNKSKDYVGSQPWEDYNNYKMVIDNVMLIKDPSVFIEPTTPVEPEEPEEFPFEADPVIKVNGMPVTYFPIDSFGSYLTQEELDENYFHRVPNVTPQNHYDDHIELGYYGEDGSKGIKFIGGAHINTGWDLFRSDFTIDKTGLTNDYDAFAFWIEVEDPTAEVYLWLYFNGNQDSKKITLPSGGSGYVIVYPEWWGASYKSTDVIGFAVGFNNPSKQYTIFLDNFAFVKTNGMFK